MMAWVNVEKPGYNPIKYTPIRGREFLSKAVTDWNLACQLIKKSEWINQAANRFYYALYRACAEHYLLIGNEGDATLEDDKFRHKIFPGNYASKTKDYKTRNTLKGLQDQRIRADYWRADASLMLVERYLCNAYDKILEIIADFKK